MWLSKFVYRLRREPTVIVDDNWSYPNGYSLTTHLKHKTIIFETWHIKLEIWGRHIVVMENKLVTYSLPWHTNEDDREEHIRNKKYLSKMHKIGTRSDNKINMFIKHVL